MVEREVGLKDKIFGIFITFVIAYTSTQLIENPIRNKKTVPKLTLWKGFGLLWVILMLVLVYCQVMNIGGYTVIEDKATNDETKNNETSR